MTQGEFNAQMERYKARYSYPESISVKGAIAFAALIESRIGEIMGDAQPKPALRAELQELIKKIRYDTKTD